MPGRDDVNVSLTAFWIERSEADCRFPTRNDQKRDVMFLGTRDRSSCRARRQSAGTRWLKLPQHRSARPVEESGHAADKEWRERPGERRSIRGSPGPAPPAKESGADAVKPPLRLHIRLDRRQLRKLSCGRGPWGAGEGASGDGAGAGGGWASSTRGRTRIRSMSKSGRIAGRQR